MAKSGENKQLDFYNLEELDTRAEKILPQKVLTLSCDD